MSLKDWISIVSSASSRKAVGVFFPFILSFLFFPFLVHGWLTDGPDTNYTLFEWSVSATPGGNLSVDSATASAAIGDTGTIDLSWAGLDIDTKYLGAVSQSDAGGVFSLTLINVSTEE
jgi:hypothetical protein